MKIFFLIIKVLIFLVFLLLAVSNIQTVEFNYLPGQGMQMPLVAVLFGAFVIGVLLGMSFWATFWVVLVWAFIAFKFKKSSLAALVAAAVTPIVAFIVIHHPSWGWALTLISVLVIVRHRSNIRRMLSGNESSIGESVQH